MLVSLVFSSDFGCSWLRVKLGFACFRMVFGVDWILLDLGFA